MNAPIVRMRCLIVELCKFMLCAVFGFGLKLYFVKFALLHFSVSGHIASPYRAKPLEIHVSGSAEAIFGGGGGTFVKLVLGKRCRRPADSFVLQQRALLFEDVWFWNRESFGQSTECGPLRLESIHNPDTQGASNAIHLQRTVPQRARARGRDTRQGHRLI